MPHRDIPLMPLFPAEFLTATQHWSFEERGAYLILLMYEWIMDGLPDDHERLARMLGISYADFAHLWPKLEPKWARNAQNFLVNPALSVHRQKAVMLMEQRRVGGVNASKKRWGNHLRKNLRLAEQLDLVDSGRTKQATFALEKQGENDEKSQDTYKVSYSDSPPYSNLKRREDKTEEKEEELRNILNPKKHMAISRAERVPMPDPPELAEFKQTYPDRDGDPRWTATKKAANARIREGHSWRQFIDGAKRYRAYCEAKDIIGTPFVMTAARFLGPEKSFELSWVPPQRKTAPKPPRSFEEWHAEARRRAETPKPWEDAQGPLP